MSILIITISQNYFPPQLIFFPRCYYNNICVFSQLGVIHNCQLFSKVCKKHTFPDPSTPLKKCTSTIFKCPELSITSVFDFALYSSAQKIYTQNNNKIKPNSADMKKIWKVKKKRTLKLSICSPPPHQHAFCTLQKMVDNYG